MEATVSKAVAKAAIKANKDLLNLKIADINKMAEEQIQESYTTLVANPDFIVAEAPATTVNNTPVDGEYVAENGARLVDLPYIGRSNGGGFKFAYGESYVSTTVNALRVLSMAGNLAVGDMFTFKADTIAFNVKYTCWFGQINMTLDARISEQSVIARDKKIAMQDKLADLKSRGISQTAIDQAIASQIKDELKSLF